MPKRRKLYLEPSFDGNELPRSTQYRASRLAANTSQVGNVMSDGGPATDEPAGNSPVRVWPNDEVDECEEFGPSVDEEGLAQNAKEDDRETEGSLGPDFSAEDIVTLVMDFAVNFGLAWTQVEHLMKLVSFFNEKKRSPLTQSFFLRNLRESPLKAWAFISIVPTACAFLANVTGTSRKGKN
ncbi:hypothetical protein MTO96_044151 [Rhipicephalus appendiculatus]